MYIINIILIWVNLISSKSFFEERRTNTKEIYISLDDVKKGNIKKPWNKLITEKQSKKSERKSKKKSKKNSIKILL